MLDRLAAGTRRVNADGNARSTVLLARHEAYTLV